MSGFRDKYHKKRKMNLKCPNLVTNKKKERGPKANK